MTNAAETLLAEALQLPASDRASLAAGLLASLDGDDTDVAAVDAAWSQETDRRARMLENGDASLVTWSHLTERIAGQRSTADET